VTAKRIPGGWAAFLCRKRYVDDQLVNALTEGIDAVVILGAGYDTRAYRLPDLAGIPVCAVDLPGSVARKAAALRTYIPKCVSWTVATACAGPSTSTCAAAWRPKMY
jgi:methyltransferase (TIGR00027 family)